MASLDSIRTCLECGCPHGLAKFSHHGRYCDQCRYSRRKFLAANPNAQKLKKRTPAKIEARLLAHRSINENGCWIWTASRDAQGYGRIANVKIPGIGNRSIAVHRLTAHLYHGLDLSKRNEYACHHCDIPACFNPEHLFVGTPTDNARDCIAKGRDRHPKGEENGGGGKLIAESVIEIRKLLSAGLTQQEIGERFGVHYSMIGRIARGEAWTHVA